jgi:hypothetical protein
VKPLWKSVCGFLKKLKIDRPYDPAIPLLGIYLKEYESVYRNTCILRFIATVFTILKL